MSTRSRRLRAACLAFCGSLATAARAEIQRVRVTKEAGSPPVVETRPLQQSPSGGGDGNGNGGNSDDGGGYRPGLLELLFGSAESASAERARGNDSGGESSSRVSSSRVRATPTGPRNRGLGLEGGPAAVWIFTNMRTAFNTPNAPNVQWDDKLALSGLGYHGSLILEGDDEAGRGTLGLEGGYFKSSRWRHVQTGANGVFASERLDVDGGWMTLWFRGYLSECVFLSGSLGGGAYSVNTRIDTNASSFTYDGLAGSRAIALVGFGGGLATPIRYRFAANVEGRWFLKGSGESSLESGGAIVSANLKARF